MLAESKILQFHAFIVLQDLLQRVVFGMSLLALQMKPMFLIVRTVDMLKFSYTRAGEHSTQCGIKHLGRVKFFTQVHD